MKGCIPQDDLEDIAKWCKVYTKTVSWFQKSPQKFGQLQSSSGKFKKLKFDVLLLSKKYILSAKTLYTDGVSNISFNCLCENSPLCHFETISYFLRHNSSVFFLAQTLHTLYNSSPSKRKFSDFSLLLLKFTKFPMSVFKQKVSFLQSLDLFSVS